MTLQVFMKPDWTPAYSDWSDITSASSELRTELTEATESSSEIGVSDGTPVGSKGFFDGIAVWLASPAAAALLAQVVRGWLNRTTERRLDVRFESSSGETHSLHISAKGVTVKAMEDALNRELGQRNRANAHTPALAPADATSSDAVAPPASGN